MIKAIGWLRALTMGLMSVFLLAAAGTAIASTPELSGGGQDPILPTGSAASADASGEVIPGRYIVVLKDSVARPANVARAQTKGHDGRLGLVYRSAVTGYSAKLSKQAVEELRKDPRVKYISPDRKIELFSQTVPTGIERANVLENSAADVDGSDDVRIDADVAVIDTGIDHTHSDLNVYKRINCVPPGEGFESEEEFEAESCEENSGTDGVGHGTHVAGTIGALDSAQGVVGVAPGARLWSVRVFAKDGFATASWWLAGFDWVKQHASQIEVANASIGCVCPIPPVAEAIEAAVEAGVAIVVAAGNNHIDVEHVTPASVGDAITVSALADYDGIPGAAAEPLVNGGPSVCTEVDHEGNFGEDDALAWFSNNGEGVDIAAPGVCILSSTPGGKYGYGNGTSMAAPHVSGAAAILASESNPGDKSDVEAIRDQLVNEGSQYWNADYLWNGLEFPTVNFPSWEMDGVQEPLLDVGPDGPATYTTRAIGIDSTGATLTGGINPGGDKASVQFEYGTTTEYGSKAPASAKDVGSGTQDIRVSETVSLVPDTTYHFRLRALNHVSQNVSFGKDMTFTTASTVSGTKATGISAHGAQLEGMVDPAGVPTSYRFEWGPTTSYGNAMPAEPKSVGSGAEPVDVSESIGGLRAGTTYHFRLAATTEEWGTIYGPDQSFTTSTLGFLPATWNEEPLQLEGDKASTYLYLPASWTVGGAEGPITACETPELEGEVSSFFAAEEKLVMTPGPSTCTAAGLYSAAVEYNGCSFEFYPGTAGEILPDEAEYAGSMTIGGSECTGLHFEFKKPAGQTLCETFIPPQGGLEAYFTNVESEQTEQVRVHVSAHARYTSTGGSWCAKGEFNDGLISATWRISASNLASQPRGILVDEPFGAAVTGDSSVHEGSSAVELEGEVKSLGRPAFYQFEYGLSTEYGQTTPLGVIEPGGPDWSEVSEEISGLVPNVDYHYRLATLSIGGEEFGEDRVFRSPQPYAPQLEAESYPATISGGQVSGKAHAFTGQAGSLACSSISLSGNTPGATSVLALAPQFSGCTFGGNFTATVSANGCKYVLHLDNAGPPYSGSADIECPQGKAIEIVKFVGGITKCIVTIPSQSGLAGLTFTNTGGGSEQAVEVGFNLSGIDYTQAKGYGGIGACTEGSFTDGTYGGASALGGLDGAEKATGVAVFGKEVEPYAPQLEAESYPATITGGQVSGKAHAFKAQAGSLNCSTVSLSGETPGATSVLALAPQFSGCTFGGNFTATVSANGCKYVLHLDNAGPPYSGSADIECPQGKAIEIVKFVGGITKCIVTIPSQSGLAGLTFTNTGGGSEQAVEVGFNLSGIDYTQAKGYGGIGACTEGSFTDGTYGGASALGGLDLPVFAAQDYPAQVTGGQVSGKAHAFTGQAGSLACSSISLSGNTPGATSVLALAPQFSGCTFGGNFTATVSANGCKYVLHLDNAGPPYSGSADIECPQGKAIEIVKFVGGITKCIVTIPSQSGLAGLTFTNTGGGSEQAVEVGFNLSGIDYTQAKGYGGIGACTEGSFTDGTYGGASALEGLETMRPALGVFVRGQQT